MIAALMLAVVLAGAPPVTWTGTVVGVVDGDTLDVLQATATGPRTMRVRLAHVDAPEKNQAYGTQAHRALSVLVYGREVAVRVVERDRYGRSVAEVTSRGESVGEALVREGWAWWYRAYSKESRYGELEGWARAAHRGLWSEHGPAPIPPWDWRRERRGR